MTITQTLSEGLKREFEIVITSSEIDKLVNEKLINIAKEAKLPGFRPGKVPISVVEAFSSIVKEDKFTLVGKSFTAVMAILTVAASESTVPSFTLKVKLSLVAVSDVLT